MTGNLGPQRGQTWRFSRQVWLFLASVFAFGLSQAFTALFLNFYLRALGLGAEWQGVMNALPAITLACLSLPAVAVARRISNAHALKVGAASPASKWYSAASSPRLLRASRSSTGVSPRASSASSATST